MQRGKNQKILLRTWSGMKHHCDMKILSCPGQMNVPGSIGLNVLGDHILR